MQGHTFRRRERAGIDAHGGFERCGRFGLIDAVNQREWHVVRVLAQDVRGALIGCRLALGTFAPGGQIAQRAKAAFTDDLLGRLDDRTEDSAHVSVFPVDWAVRKREIRLLEIASIDVKEQISRSRGLAPLHDLREHGTDRVPDFGPDRGAGRAEGPWMLGGSKDRSIFVVVEDDEIPSPPQHDGKCATQAGADRRQQRLGPLFECAERRLRPVEGSDALAHLATGREPAQRLRMIVHTKIVSVIP